MVPSDPATDRQAHAGSCVWPFGMQATKQLKYLFMVGGRDALAAIVKTNLHLSVGVTLRSDPNERRLPAAIAQRVADQVLE